MPTNATSFTRVLGRNFTIVERPAFHTYRNADFGFAEDNFPVTFVNDWRAGFGMGLLAPNEVLTHRYIGNQPGVRPGDWVVMQSDNCNNAQLAVNGPYSMARQQLDDSLTVWTEIRMNKGSIP